ncbi:hypothetical protein QBC34DRAFT_411854 [Podospora aff. communis PSN243]|uniref:Zn(2)-C6 fungal-type domain-containing protein n=1 Tax=Podospora aff. communis PSN243 TaxID=3040156 RepID=A0AAV9GG83_9PEZI|nr:hypothetical protein QBC34DRAFT_411854 [Podospora aff. communis PSN243]
MPGVPSGRGCDACRQVKKKCDQANPECSRCTRLGISCVGSGQRRFKFVAVPERQSRGTGAEPSKRSVPSSTYRAESALALSPPLPSNQETQDLSSLISALEVTDVRFDLRIFGPFLPEIPRRLGKSQALDSSVRALVVSFPSVYTRQPTPDMYKSYGEALRHLRVALADSSASASPETLCAVYMVIICQGWIGRGGDFFPSHGEAMAHMLNTAAARRDWMGEFEAEIVNTLVALCLLESFANPKINLDPRLWEPSPDLRPIPRPSRPKSKMSTDIKCLQPSYLAAVSGYIRDVQGHLPDILAMHQTLQDDLVRMKTLLAGVAGKGPRGQTLTERRLQVRWQTGYGVLLLLGLMANWALATYGLGDAVCLEGEMVMLVDEVAELAQEAAQYRPLGSSAMPAFIIAAKMMTQDPAKLKVLQDLLVLYRSDFPVVTAELGARRAYGESSACL